MHGATVKTMHIYYSDNLTDKENGTNFQNVLYRNSA